MPMLYLVFFSLFDAKFSIGIGISIGDGLSGGNSLCYQKHVQIIHKLTRNSITSKVWVFIFIVI